MSSTTIYRVANDAAAPAMVCTLTLDGVAITTDLSGATVTAHMQNVADTTNIVEIVCVGGENGQVTTPFAQTDLVAGRYTLEWEVSGGATYPGDKSERPQVVIRSEVS